MTQASGHPSLGGVSEKFAAQVLSVHELLEFDSVILDHAVGSLIPFADGQPHSVRTAILNKVQTIRNVRVGGSLRSRYSTMYNQCVVLLVSYFGSALDDLFRMGVSAGLHGEKGIPAESETLKVSYRDLSSATDGAGSLFATLLIDQMNTSFQDMQSTTRAFRDCLGIDLPRDERTNDIILGQAARHVMVHAGGKLNPRFKKQVVAANPRRIKQSLPDHGTIQFDPDEVKQLAASMQGYLASAVEAVSERVA